MEQETNAIGNVTKYRYNSKMLLEEMIVNADPKQRTEYRYDSLNRLKEVEDKLSTIRYHYDANGNIIKVEEKDKGITKLLTATKTIHREFDELNRVTKYTDYKGREVKYDYDALGNMVELTYPGGATVKYAYRDDGQVQTMTSNSGGTFYTWEYAYDDYGRLRYIYRPDGTEEFRDYNDAGDLVEQVDMKGDTVIQKNTYVYDVFGEITTKSTSNTADPSVIQTVNMKYDAANRLIKYNGQDVEYDDKGNMTKGPVDGEMQELTYDCRNRLIQAGGVSYTYDAENTRISTTVDGRTTEYVTDTGGSLSRLLIAYEADGTETSYYYGAEGLSGQYNDGTKERLYYHYDNIGSTTLLTDVAGKVIERYVYGTYGELLSEVTKKVRFLYNGAYGVTTDENGLYYMRARYYNPDIKRFINQDIKVGDIGSSQSLNRYAYCEGNPVSLIDPFGLSPQGTNGIWDILGAILSELTIHDLLGVAGFIPVLGVVADVADTVIYYCEGHPVEGTISLLCAIPGLGDAFGISIRGSKIVKTGKRIANLLIDAGKNTRTAAKVADAAKAAKNLVKFAGGKAGDFAHAAGNMIVKGFKAGASKLDDAANLLRHQGDKLYTSAKNAVKKLKGGSVDDIIVDGVGKKILNVGAGEFAIPCAINIDTNPRVSGVIFGDVYNLSQFTTGEFDHIISMNPFAYDLLESDVLRVLKEGGRMTITGNLSNIHFRRIYRASAEKLKKYGLEIVSTGRVQEIFMKYGGKISDGSRRVGGEILQIVLRKTGGI